MKKRILICLILIFLSSSLFANGEKENSNYIQLVSAANQNKDYVQIPNLSVSEFQNLAKDFELDHPEFFWIDSLSFIPKESKIVFEKSLSQNEIAKIQKQIDSLLKEKNFTDLYSIYSFFISECFYNSSNLDQTMYSALISKNGVCTSFAKAFKFLADKLGYTSYIVEGFIGNTPHVWNKVRINGKFLNVDVSWALTSGKECYLVKDKDLKISHKFSK